MRRTPPLIVGGGPSGCAAAILLAHEGGRPVILERTPYGKCWTDPSERVAAQGSAPSREAIAQHSQSVQQQEYIERAERRSEQHEERMNQAEAYKHATSGQNVILLNNHRKAHRVTPIFIR